MIRYQITDGTIPLSPEADIVQVRNELLGPRALASLVRELLYRAATVRERMVFVNDRIDIALATGAHGVHLKSNSISPSLVPKGLRVSVACHNEDDLRRAEGADYALLSPVFDPISKSPTHPALGLTEFARLVKLSPVPVIALGGITEANAAECIAAGAAGVAGISLFARD